MGGAGGMGTGTCWLARGRARGGNGVDFHRPSSSCREWPGSVGESTSRPRRSGRKLWDWYSAAHCFVTRIQRAVERRRLLRHVPPSAGLASEREVPRM